MYLHHQYEWRHLPQWSLTLGHDIVPHAPQTTLYEPPHHYRPMDSINYDPVHPKHWKSRGWSKGSRIRIGNVGMDPSMASSKWFVLSMMCLRGFMEQAAPVKVDLQGLSKAKWLQSKIRSRLRLFPWAMELLHPRNSTPPCGGRHLGFLPGMELIALFRMNC